MGRNARGGSRNVEKCQILDCQQAILEEGYACLDTKDDNV